jgi:MoaA/NifB/PqqE/SkfB family radical SAM enzyme
MCDLPGRAAGPGSRREELSKEEMRQVLTEMRRLGVMGVGFTGGEPLLRADLFDLLSYTKGLGMIAHLNSNGFLLDEERARKIVELKVDSVNISVDGCLASTHDRIRGVTGAHERAVAAVRRLASTREEARSKEPRLKVVCVVQEENACEIETLCKEVRRWGADIVEFIPVQGFSDGLLVGQGGQPSEALLASGRTLSILKREGQAIENSYGMLSLFEPTVRGEPSPLACSAGYNSIVVDCYGDVFPCVPFMNWNIPFGNIRVAGLAAVWSSDRYGEMRHSIESCKKCTLNCQAELNLLF